MKWHFSLNPFPFSGTQNLNGGYFWWINNIQELKMKFAVAARMEEGNLQPSDLCAKSNTPTQIHCTHLEVEINVCSRPCVSPLGGPMSCFLQEICLPTSRPGVLPELRIISTLRRSVPLEATSAMVDKIYGITSLLRLPSLLRLCPPQALLNLQGFPKPTPATLTGDQQCHPKQCIGFKGLRINLPRLASKSHNLLLWWLKVIHCLRWWQ